VSVRRVCVFCGSKPGARPVYLEAARETGRALAAAGVELVYGGAHGGLMGAVADGVLESGQGVVIGIIPRGLRGLSVQEFAHPRLTQTHVVTSMHERKTLMHDLSDAFLALPGGFGTLDELFEALTWAQLDFHRKPVGLLNVENYYGALLDFVRHGVREGFVPAPAADRLLVDASPAELVRRVCATV
jgi:uncharacterized protein (TIGR00730 family)